MQNPDLLLHSCAHRVSFGSGLDQNHGGEYAAYEDLIERFVRALRDCGITPYVVMDGGTDSTDKKFDTLLERAQSRIRAAHQAAAEDRKTHILPRLIKMVFKQTLARLEVPLAQCYGEADQQIVALANEWKCPVLSSDSDFYIFNLPGGLLPISHFRWEEVEQTGSQRYICCKSYHASSFCIVFDLQPELLPVLAALNGNDYVKLKRMETVIKWAEFAPTGCVTSVRLEGLLCWLKNFKRPGDALEAALGLMGNLDEKKKAEVLSGLNLGIKEYKVPPSSLSRFFIHGIAPPLPAADKVPVPIPDWILLPLTQARLNPDILDVLQMQRTSLCTCVDHKDTPSANLISRPLRQVMYALLLGGGTPLQVEERDREELNVKFTQVPPAFRGVAQRLVLSSLNKAEPCERLELLLDTLQVSEASLSHLPPQLRLPVAVTCYWVQRAQPLPGEELVKALLLLYEGTFIHALVHRMRTTGRIKSLLKSDHSSVRRYRSMLTVVHRFHAHRAATPPDGHNKTEAPPPQRQRPLDDLTSGLKQLFLQYNDEEAETEISSAARAQEDQSLDEMLSVKTRYRTKDRRNRSDCVDLARKEECRGRDLL
ncbi:hypothetical protein INR49_007271 [Caranx melampygus]|nr:hypothetical protein INR49_007271 [Caranx melampygus]